MPVNTALLRTVLVVDNDADMRLYVRGCLESSGLAEVVEASDGAQALALAHALTPDLVVSDLSMPTLSGDALCRALKAHPSTSTVPILFIGGESDTPPHSGDSFLPTPFNSALFCEHVERLIGQLAPSHRSILDARTEPSPVTLTSPQSLL